MALSDILQPFTWGAGGAKLTPEEIARQRQLADALTSQGIDLSPIASPWQGAARMADALVGNIKSARADRAEKANADYSAQIVQGLLGGQQFPAAPSVSGTTSPVAPPAAPIDYPSQRVASAFAASGDAPAVPEGYFDAIRSAESGGSDTAKNPLSSATGRYQFTKGTWDGLMTAHPELGLTPDGRTDPAQQERAIRAFTAQNAGQLQDAGIPVSGGDLYAAHFLGADGAKNVLTQPDNALVSAYVSPQVIASNPFLRNMSVGQFKRWAASKGGGSAPVGAAPALPAPVNVPDMPIAGQSQPVQVAQAANAGTPGQMNDADALTALGASAYKPGDINPAIVQALSDPRVNDTTRQIATMLVKQRLDPNAALDTEYKRAQIANLNSMVHQRNDPNARNRFGNNVIWGQDATGNWVAMQPTSAGGLVPAQVPDGVKLSPPGVSNLNLGTQFGIRDRNGQLVNTVPIDNAGKAAATAEGTAQGGAAFDLPRVEQNAEQTLGILDRMKTHPGREGSTGFIEGMLPSRTPAQVDFQSLVDQTQGQSFLQAFQMLKGGGQITEVEGQKATDAISRLRNQRLSDADYLQAINDLEDVVKKGLARAKVQAGQGSAPSGAASAPAIRRYNPQTGELE